MRRILMNQKTVKERNAIRVIQRGSRREYCRAWGGPRTRIGKLVRMNSGEFNGLQTDNPLPEHIQVQDILDLLEQNQLTGMSGNGVPVRNKIEMLLKKTGPKLLLINGVECEPGLLHDEWILASSRDEVMKGIQILSDAIRFDRRVLAHKVLKKDRRNRWSAAGIEDLMVPARYPMGEERLLIKQVFGLDIPKGAYPADQGILVLNVQTVVQIYRLLAKQYRDGRYVTLADLGSGEARVVFVERGEYIKAKLLRYFPHDAETDCFAGSGIMSSAPVDEQEIFTDQICFAAIGQPAKLSNITDCKGCGSCNRKCPSKVDVRGIVKTLERDPQANLKGFGAENCISCGSCTFFCRAGKDISEYLDTYRR